MIPGSGRVAGGKSPPGTNSPHNGVSQVQNGHDQVNSTILGMNQLGLFDLTASSPKSAETAKDMEINRLRDELSNARSRLNNWDESYAAVRQACEVWKKEAAMSTKKCEMAMKDKELLLNKLGQMQKEYESIQQGNGQYLHAVKRVSELKSLPLTTLKHLQWQVQKDLLEVEKVFIGDLYLASMIFMMSHFSIFQAIRHQENGSGSQWPNGNGRLFDFNSGSANDHWSTGSLGLIQSHQQHLFGSLN